MLGVAQRLRGFVGSRAGEGSEDLSAGSRRRRRRLEGFVAMGFELGISNFFCLNLLLVCVLFACKNKNISKEIIDHKPKRCNFMFGYY